MKITRRRLAIALSAPAAAALAQAPDQPREDEELKAARARIKAAGDALARQQIPMSTEPAFQFKA